MSTTPTEQPILVNTIIGDATSFCRTIEMLCGVSSTIPITFNAEGITITTVIDSKKKKTNNIYMEASFKRWNTHSYIYSNESPKEIALKFDKNTIAERVKSMKKDETFGMVVRKDIQGIYTLVNGKGEDKMSAIIESTSDSAQSNGVILTLSPDNKPVAWSSRKDYADLCTAVKRNSPCDVKIEVYDTGINFLIVRYGVKEALSYKSGHPVGEKRGTYTVDSSVFTLINTKVQKIVSELATVTFHVIQRNKDNTSAIFVTEMPIGFIGMMRIYYSADKIVNTTS